MRRLLIAFCLCCPAHKAAAQSAPEPQVIEIELNSIDQVEQGCQLTFVAANRAGTDLDAVIYEAVLFDTAGKVDRLTLFDFGAVPQDKSRVRQFILPDLECADLGKVLFNGANRCDAANGDASLCSHALAAVSRTGVEVSE